MKTILGNFVFINEENKSKEIQGKNVLSFTKFVLGGFCPGGFRPGGAFVLISPILRYTTYFGNNEISSVLTRVVVLLPFFCRIQIDLQLTIIFSFI